MPGGKGKINEYNKSLTAEQRKASAIKAATAPRKSKTIREFVKAICENPAPAAAKKSLAEFGIENEEMKTAALIALSIVRAAIEGDMKAVEKVERYLGQQDKTKREELEEKVLEVKIKAIENGNAVTDPVNITIAPREKKDEPT